MTHGPSGLIELGESTSFGLIARLKLRDAEAWRRTTRLYAPLVFRWTRRAGVRESDAADVTQDVFHAVARHIDGFRNDAPGSTFRGWLYTIARNKLYDHFRRQAGDRGAVGGTDALQQIQELPATPPDGEEGEAEQSDLARRAMALLQSDFQPATWQAFWATAVDNRPAAEVAANLGISLAAVYKAKSRVLARLRQELGS